MRLHQLLKIGFAALTLTWATQAAVRPLEMKLLVLSADGTEPSFDAMKNLLDHMAVPYQAVVLRNQPLPALAANGQGKYQGIILSTGSLTYYDGANWTSALSSTDWTNIENYMRDYNVRLASFYTFPEPRYGLTFTTAMSTTDSAPGMMSLTSAGQGVFDYLNASAAMKVMWSYTYLATATPAAGETTTPLLTMGGGIVGATHKKADGREYLALTMDQSPYLTHSMALHYGIVNWVTRGVFIGMRRVYLMPQDDDFFLPSSMFVSTDPACRPGGATSDPTFNNGDICPTVRVTAADLSAVANWQSNVRSKSQYRYFKVAHAFNGFGASPDFGLTNDPLLAEATRQKSAFNWLSHTYSHENLDCYLPVENSGVCPAATYAQAVSEFDLNKTMGTKLQLSNDVASMVTPGISGLTNANFLRAFYDRGGRYLVTDTSKPGGLPVIPNTAIPNPLQPNVIMVPRRATNIFYNTATPNAGAIGSETDEYNFMFGPNGLFRVGGPGGAPFFNTNQTYAQIIDREADAIVLYMMRGELYPLMFHQANFNRYNGVNSLFTDLMDAVMRKWTATSKLPVSTLKQSTLGNRLKELLDLTTANVKGVFIPGVGVTITSSKSVNVPVTGVCDLLGCEAVYNGQRQDRVKVNAGSASVLMHTTSSPGADKLSEDN